MKVTIFGTGYVGLVTGACLAEVGNHVLCMDLNESKIAQLKAGEVPIYEPGLELLIEKNTKQDRLKFTTNKGEAVEHADIIFIAVGTPSDENGAADLSHVLAVASSIGELMLGSKLIVDKSTVPVGTADKVKAEIEAQLGRRNLDIGFDVASNPEFLKEGAAIEDFMKPDRVVVGTESHEVEARLRKLYEPFTRNHDRLICMSTRSAELTKYAANAMLATKISFMNEMSNLAEKLGADIEEVRHGIGSDPRIGYQFIYPGVGFGGSCFPKDVRALVSSAKANGYSAQLISAVDAVNENQKEVLFTKIYNYYGGELKGKTIALWGLAFKPKTDDMREAPSRVLMERLWQSGAQVQAYDPEAMDEAQRIYGDTSQLAFCSTPEETLDGASCLVVVTEWNVFRSPDFELVKSQLSDSVIFDGRNIYSPVEVERYGLSYFGIGRR